MTLVRLWQHFLPLGSPKYVLMIVTLVVHLSQTRVDRASRSVGTAAGGVLGFVRCGDGSERGVLVAVSVTLALVLVLQGQGWVGVQGHQGIFPSSREGFPKAMAENLASPEHVQSAVWFVLLA